MQFYPKTAGFRTFSLHWRNVVGVSAATARELVLSMPSFLAVIMSARPSANASDMSRLTILVSVGPDGSLLIANGPAQNNGEDFCHLIGRDVFRTQDRHVCLTCPCGVHQELCCHCGDIRSSDQGSFEGRKNWEKRTDPSP